MDFLSDQAQRSLIALGYSDWISCLDQLVEKSLEEYGLELIKPLAGGRAGTVIQVSSDKEIRVLKLSPPDITPGQANALRALGGKPFPKLLDSNHLDGSILMEYIPSEPCPERAPLDLDQGARIVRFFEERPLENYFGTHLEQLTRWLDSQIKESPGPTMLGRIALAKRLMDEAPSDNYRHIHGDLGNYNLIEDKNREIWAVDPLGIQGPAAYDAASFIVHSGFNSKEISGKIGEIAELLELQPLETARWAAVRSTALAMNSHNCEEWLRYRYYNDVADTLVREFKLPAHCSRC